MSYCLSRFSARRSRSKSERVRQQASHHQQTQRRIASATVLTMAASLLVAGPVRQAVADPDPQNAMATGPAVTTFPRPEDPDAALRAAVEEAKKLNKPVTVEEAFTETTRT